MYCLRPSTRCKPNARTPCFWLVTYQAAANHTRNGVRVLSKMVPAVTVLWCRQSLHINRMRLTRYGGVMLPQLGHAKPLGHRSRSRYVAHASSDENQSRNSFHVRG